MVHLYSTWQGLEYPLPRWRFPFTSGDLILFVYLFFSPPSSPGALFHSLEPQMELGLLIV